MTHYRHLDTLMQELAYGIMRNGDARVHTLSVVVYVGDASFEIGDPGEALDKFVNDVYWDERGDWREADRLEVKTV